MIETVYNNVLWMTVVWPLLLAVPALHTRLPWPRHLAVVPAIVVILLPGELSLTIPWLLSGTDFAGEGNVRWLLFMAILVWLSAASITNVSRSQPAQSLADSLFMLTLAGNLGAILATDLVSLFCFTTLMGYGFYGLLVEGGNTNLQRAGRLYLVCLVLADLALFEALLLGTYYTDKQTYDVMQMALPDPDSAPFYVLMICIAFALKSGAWPFHFWLTALYRSAPPAKTILLGAVPLSTALLLALRWSVINQQNFPVLSMVLLLLGGIAILYAAIRITLHSRCKLLPAWTAVAITGIFMMALGSGLAQPDRWHQYQYLGYPMIAIFGIMLAILSYIVRNMPDEQSDNLISTRIQAVALHVLAWTDTCSKWAGNKWLALQSQINNSRQTLVKLFAQVEHGQKTQGILAGWNVKLTVFVLLGLTILWLAI